MQETEKITKENLVLDPFNGIEIESLDIKRKINEHGTLVVKGKILSKNKDFVNVAESGVTSLRLYSKVNDEIIFQGIIDKMEIHLDESEEVDTFILECVTTSSLLDIEKGSETFQNIEEKYSNMVDKVFSKYNNNKLNFRVDDKKIGGLIIRYEETDWEFLKRLASRFEVGLFTTDMINSSNICFGVPNISKNVVIDESSVTVKNLMKEDCLECDVQISDVLELGESVTYRDIEYFVKVVDIELIDDELVCKYTITTENGLKQKLIENEQNKRGAHKGRVIDVLDNGIKIHFTELDEQQNIDSAMIFSLDGISVIVKMEGMGKTHPAIGDEVFVECFHSNLRNC